MKLVLASESPSRRRALEILGLSFEIRPSRMDEKAIRHPEATELVRLLASAKATISSRGLPDAIVVAGDAVVSKGVRIFEKPRNLSQAEEFLRNFSGSTVDYVTAIAVANTATGELVTDVQLSKISFRVLFPKEIADYVGRYDVLACAGAFESDGVARFSTSVSGPCNYLTGFSINELLRMLRRNGVKT